MTNTDTATKFANMAQNYQDDKDAGTPAHLITPDGTPRGLSMADANSRKTTAERQAIFRAKKEALATFNEAEVKRLTSENQVLTKKLAKLTTTYKLAKERHIAEVAKLQRQLLAFLPPVTTTPD